MMDVPDPARRHFQEDLRRARALALQNAEAFGEVIFAIERLGAFVRPDGTGLGDRAGDLAALAGRSALATEAADKYPGFHTPFATLYSLMKDGRNDALHQGARARTLTRHAIETALILEDALMTDCSQVRDFMIDSPVCARLWEPISSLRRTMLLNSFSFLPVQTDEGSPWRLLSDHALALFLRGTASNGQRKRNLAMTLGQVVDSGQVRLLEARTCVATDSVTQVIGSSNGGPVLVLRAPGASELVGILTSFDVL